MAQLNQNDLTSPFPGMDPYFEGKMFWRSFHHHLAEEIVRMLNPTITPKYFADVELHSSAQELVISQLPPHVTSETHHMYPDVTISRYQSQSLSPQPSVAVMDAPAGTVLDAPIERVIGLPKPETLRTVNIYLTGNNGEDAPKLVTAIELLSPANKTGINLIKYQEKRSLIIQSDVHLIEIDLLRGGQRPGPEVNEPPIDTDYIILRNSEHDNFYRISKIWPVAINEPLPTIPIPLLSPDPDVPLDLNAIVQSIYQTHYYGLRVNYTQPVPPPKLRPEMAEWWENWRKTVDV
ncbi:MAG: DUF4058 family protein [Chloroflexota bacterium]